MNFKKDFGFSNLLFIVVITIALTLFLSPDVAAQGCKVRQKQCLANAEKICQQMSQRPTDETHRPTDRPLHTNQECITKEQQRCYQRFECTGCGSTNKCVSIPYGPINTMSNYISQNYIGVRPNGEERFGRVDAILIEGSQIRFSGLGDLVVVGQVHIPAFGGDGGPAANALLNNATTAVLDRERHQLYIADSVNNRIRMVDLLTAGKTIQTVAGGALLETICTPTNPKQYKCSCSTATTPNGDGCPATFAHLSLPMDVAVDGQGNLFIGDNGDTTVRRVDFNTKIIKTVGNTHLADFLADCHKPSLDCAQSCPCSGPGGYLHGPNSLAWDADGNRYRIKDWLIKRQDADPPYGDEKTIVGMGQGALNGNNGDGGPALMATLNNPRGVAVDGEGNLYIAGYSIRKVSPPITQVTFPNTAVGSHARQDVWVEINTQLDYSGSFSIQASKGAAGGTSFAVVPDAGCSDDGITMPAGKICTVQITFRPTSQGTAQATLVVGKLQLLQLSGNGTR